MTWDRSIPSDSEWVHEQATADQRRIDRVRSWRRRVLQRRGALMHTALLRECEHSSLAMLDEAGIVVAWYGEAGASSEHVVDRHVSQFYLPRQLAGNQPLRDLRAAAVGGCISREGWRRRTDGTIFWGHVVIEAVVLRDGRLQGYSFVMQSATDRLTRRASCLAPLLLGLSVCASLPVAAARADAHLDYSGSHWTCDAGFQAHGAGCAAD
jgi:hypothetical protein